MGYYGLLELGITSALTRYIARYTAKKEHEKLNNIASSVFYLFLIIAFVIVVVSFGFSYQLAEFFNVSMSDRKAFIVLICLVGTTTGISFPGNFFGAVNNAREHFLQTNVVNVFRNIFRVIFVVVLIKIGFGVVGIGISVLLSTVFGSLANYIVYRKFASDIKISISSFSVKVLKGMFVYGIFTTIITLANLLRTEIDNVVIAKFVGFNSVAVYGVSAILIRYISHLVISANSVLTPRFAMLDGVSQTDELKTLFKGSIFISSFISMFILAISLLYGDVFIGFWVGDEFWFSSFLFKFIVIAWIVDLAQNPGVGLMYATNKHRYYALAVFIEGLLNLTISLLLVSKFGLLGVAIGTFLPMVVIRVFLQPYLISRILNIKLLEYFRTFEIPVLTFLSVYLLVDNIGIFHHIASRGILSLVVMSILSSILFFIIFRVLIWMIKIDIKINNRYLKLFMGV